jgi:hypothetical protein
MLYHNIKSGNTVFPQLRPGPEVQQKEILSTFWNFFAEARWVRVVDKGQERIIQDRGGSI